MKALMSSATAVLLAISTAAHASSGAESGGGSLMIWLFFGLVGCIIILQFIPGMTLFLGMLKGMFSAMDKKTEATEKVHGRSN